MWEYKPDKAVQEEDEEAHPQLLTVGLIETSPRRYMPQFPVTQPSTNYQF